MSDYSIAHAQDTGQINVPGLRARVSKRLALKLLQHIQVGRIVLYDGNEIYRFGSETNRSKLAASVHIEHPEAYHHVVRAGVLGAGEAYILGLWSSPDLVTLVRVFCANIQAMQTIDQQHRFRKLLRDAWRLFSFRNNISGSKRNIVAHYDLSNEFFASFLDQSMMYSSAIFPRPDASLEEAAEYKLRRICERLQLRESDHLLEIGSGWGALACYAVKHYGCRVTTTTISDQQYRRAQQRIRDEGLEDRITLLDWDYRNLQGRFDKIVSVEMIEAVGHEYYAEYFQTCERLLKDDGLLLIQAITIADQRYEQSKNSVDFIKKYIFPGGCLPSNAVLSKHIADDTSMMIVGLEDIGLHYADTLAHWRQRFEDGAHRLREFGFDQRFKRMWDYYLMYCEGGFRERAISTVQLLAAKPQCHDLPAIAK